MPGYNEYEYANLEACVARFMPFIKSTHLQNCTNCIKIFTHTIIQSNICYKLLSSPGYDELVLYSTVEGCKEDEGIVENAEDTDENAEDTLGLRTCVLLNGIACL